MFGSNTDATGQTGEPSIAGSPADTSVWYSWTAPESGPTSFNTRDAAFDTTLHVFTGSSLGALTSVASNDDFNGTLQSKVTFNATAGTTYRIAVDGFSAAHGPFSLQWAQNSPANDNFATPAAITGATGKHFGNTARSTGEPGEPNHGSIPDRSVWYSWTAPETGSAVFNTRESNFDTVVAAYTGTTITGLTQLASNDQFNGTNQSKITFPVTAGTTYRIAVDGFGATTGSLGLQWSINPPANDNFAAPRVLTGLSGMTPATTVRATGEPGELDYHGGAIADNSAWFSWTPTASGPAVVRLRRRRGWACTRNRRLHRHQPRGADVSRQRSNVGPVQRGRGHDVPDRGRRQRWLHRHVQPGVAARQVQRAQRHHPRQRRDLGHGGR